MRLRILEVIRKSWWRSQLLVEAEESGELFFGNFTLPPLFSLAGTMDFQQHRYQLVRGQRLHLVCRGGDWRVGEDVPKAKIVYRYEP